MKKRDVERNKREVNEREIGDEEKRKKGKKKLSRPSGIPSPPFRDKDSGAWRAGVVGVVSQINIHPSLGGAHNHLRHPVYLDSTLEEYLHVDGSLQGLRDTGKKEG